jgi:hypothetical protein
MYGENVPGVDVCPGEADCQIFAGVAGKTRGEKERKACLGGGKVEHACKMLPTKTQRGKKIVATCEELVNDGFIIRRRRDSGYPVPLDEMTPLHFEALMMIEAEIEHQEITLRTRTVKVLLSGFGLKVES